MASAGPTKTDRDKALTPTPAAAATVNMALQASSSYLNNPFTRLYTAFSTAVTSISSTVSNTLRGKKRNAEEALEQAPAAEEITPEMEAQTDAAIAAAKDNGASANAAAKLAKVTDSMVRTSDIRRERARQNHPLPLQFWPVDSKEGQRLLEGRETMRKAGMTPAPRRKDGENPLKRVQARRNKQK